MSTLITIFKLFPSLVTAVKAVEEFAPVEKIGGGKLDLILGVIRDLAPELSNELIPAITKVVARIVKFANDIGLFKKAGA